MAQVINPYQEFHRQCLEAAKTWSASVMPESKWLQDTRTQALNRFAELTLPTRKTENWKYTPIHPIVKGDLLRLAAANEVTSADAGLIEGQYHRLVFQNGYFTNSTGNTDDRLEIVGFSEANADQRQLIEKHLNQTVELAKHPFATLNAGTLQDGVLIHIKSGQRIDQPILIEHVTDVAVQSFSSFTRVLVVLEANAQTTVIEHHYDRTIGATLGMSNTLAEFFLAEGSHCTHYALNTEGENHIHTGLVSVEQQRRSQFEQHNFATGGKLKRRDLQVFLKGPQADCNLVGAYLIGGKNHVDYHTTIEHIAPHCTSTENFRGIVTDFGKAVFNGRIHIHPDAQQSNADMSNKNLLLTNTAEVNTKPELEIYADDVKCAHGATVGQLDEKALFYFQSRGIPRAEAFKMLSHAFIESILAEMDEESVHAYIEKVSSDFYQHCQEGA